MIWTHHSEPLRHRADRSPGPALIPEAGAPGRATVGRVSAKRCIAKSPKEETRRHANEMSALAQLGREVIASLDSVGTPPRKPAVDRPVIILSMRRFIDGFGSTPLLFAIITILAYGLLLPFTGFYWDDWPFAWIAHFLGPAEFIPAFESFRPFLGPIFFLTTSLIPTEPIYWQIFALIIRFLLVLSAWWMFKSVWPNHPRSVLAASLLLLIFPGYSQHWVALTHINQELIPLIFYILSFGFTARAIRTLGEPEPGDLVNNRSKPAPFVILTMIAILLQICGLFPTEYFFGLEILRLLFILALLSRIGIGARLIQAFRLWLPYLAVWLLNAAWLIYYYTSGVYVSYETPGLQTLSIPFILLDLLDTIWKTGFYIWVQIIGLLARSLSQPSSILAMVLLALSFFPLYFYLSRVQNPDNKSSPMGPQLLIIGLAGILAGRLPSLAAGLPLKLQSSYDRFMVSMFLGGSLFVVGILESFVHNNRIRNVLVALLVSLGIGQQFFNANIFRRDWEKQGQIYWQLSWRIPGLHPNTVLLTHQMPIDYETDLSFTAPINWLLAPAYKSGALPYAMLYTEKRLGGPTLPALEPGVRINFPYRTVEFDGNTSQAIVLFLPPNGCLRVLDPELGDAVIYQKESSYLVEAIPLSDPDRILTEEPSSGEPVFFREPENDWCFYYTHAELARQQGDWQKIITLWDEALSQGFSPSDPLEYLPFIEAAVRSDNWTMVERITKTIAQDGVSSRNPLCVLWNRLLEDSTIDNATRSKILLHVNGLNCSS